PRQPPPEPRLRAGAKSARTGGPVARAAGRGNQQGNRGRHHRAPRTAKADPGVSSLSDGVSRSERDDRVPSRHLSAQRRDLATFAPEPASTGGAGRSGQPTSRLKKLSS